MLSSERVVPDLPGDRGSGSDRLQTDTVLNETLTLSPVCTPHTAPGRPARSAVDEKRAVELHWHSLGSRVTP